MTVESEGGLDRVRASRSDEPMDWRTLSARCNGGDEHGHEPVEAPRRWIAHASHGPIAAPHRSRPRFRGESSAVSESAPTPAPAPTPRLVTLDGSKGEGGGQILRTALTL